MGFLADRDVPAGEGLDRAKPAWRLDADIDWLWRFHFFGLSAVTLEDVLAGERL
jgi:hypothetical protein